MPEQSKFKTESGYEFSADDDQFQLFLEWWEHEKSKWTWLNKLDIRTDNYLHPVRNTRQKAIAKVDEAFAKKSVKEAANALSRFYGGASNSNRAALYSMEALGAAVLRLRKTDERLAAYVDAMACSAGSGNSNLREMRFYTEAGAILGLLRAGITFESLDMFRPVEEELATVSDRLNEQYAQLAENQKTIDAMVAAAEDNLAEFKDEQEL